MATSKRPPENVDAFIAALGHARGREILAVRQRILGTDPRIADGIKWNAPSFRTTEWFATVHLRAKDGVQIIMHLGAKPRDGAVAIDDPTGMLTWLGKDRASVTFRDMSDVDARGPTFANVVRQWIAHV